MNENSNGTSEAVSHPDNDKHWMTLAAIVLIGICTAMLVPAFTTQQLHPMALLYSVALAAGSFSGIWWYRKKPVWKGLLTGAALGILLFVIAQATVVLLGTLTGS